MQILILYIHTFYFNNEYFWCLVDISFITHNSYESKFCIPQATLDFIVQSH